MTSDQNPGRPWVTFACWACLGLMAGFGVAALLTVGIVLLLAAAILAVVLLWRTPHQRASVFGLGIGFAVVAGYIGWLNRDGPGTACHSGPGGTVTCVEEWTPWPFFVAAGLLAAASVGLFLHVRRRMNDGGSAMGIPR